MKKICGYSRWILALLVVVSGFLTALITFFSGQWEMRHLLIFVVSYGLIMGGVTVGYHRYLTHRTFAFTKIGAWTAKPLVLLAGCFSWQGPPLLWAFWHDLHHRCADAEGDPHSPHGPTRSFWRRVFQFFWAHALWIPHASRDMKNFVAARKPGRVERFCTRWYLLVGPTAGIIAAYAIGGWRGIAWYLAAVFVTLNTGWLVNSAGHLLGRRRFPTPDQSTNLWWLAMLTGGEGWHNNHHAFQKSARFAHTNLEKLADVGWWMICFLRACRMVSHIHVPPAHRLSPRSPA